MSRLALVGRFGDGTDGIPARLKPVGDGVSGNAVAFRPFGDCQRVPADLDATAGTRFPVHGRVNGPLRTSATIEPVGQSLVGQTFEARPFGDAVRFAMRGQRRAFPLSDGRRKHGVLRVPALPQS